MNDRHEQSRPAFEEAHQDMTRTRMKDGRYFSGMMQVHWEAWCRALDYAAEQQAKQKDEHVCAMHMDMMGTCFVCGSVNESIRQAREAEESARPKDTAPTPLTRPDRPGWWWRWAEADKEWACCHVTDPQWVGLGLWLPATPPPAPTQTNHQ